MRTRHKDVGEVRFIIENSFGNLNVDSIRFIGHGNDCDAYEINGSMIFKFPKHDQADRNIIKEIEILRFLESKISYRIPRVLYAGLPSIRFKYHFGGFSRIDGVPLSRALYSGLSEEEKEVLARELAGFLKELHGLHVEGIDSYKEDMNLKYRDDWGMLVKLISPKLDDGTASKLDDLYRGIFSNKDLLDMDKGLVHNDFSCSNILFDTEKKRISGVIDFGDSCVSDIDNDFYCLLEESEEELGREFGLKVLSYYGYGDVDRLLRKADFHERYWCVEQILYGYEYGYGEWISEGMKGLKEWIESV